AFAATRYAAAYHVPIRRRPHRDVSEKGLGRMRRLHTALATPRRSLQDLRGQVGFDFPVAVTRHLTDLFDVVGDTLGDADTRARNPAAGAATRRGSAAGCPGLRGARPECLRTGSVPDR